MNPCSAAEHHLRRQPALLAARRAEVAKVLYPAFTSNDPANTYLATGQAQWGSQFIPNIESFYTVQEPGQPLLVPADRERDPDPQPDRARAEQRAVRQAMAYAIDRNRVSQIGEYGYELAPTRPAS